MAVATAGEAGAEAPAAGEAPVASPEVPVAGPGHGGPFTWDYLESLPDDSLRRELVDGQLLVSPAPRRLHQRAVGELYLLLRLACPDELEVVLSPCDWKLSATTVFVPDLMVLRRDQFHPTDVFTGTPLLVVEVRSPSTAVTDRTLKRQQYEQYGAAAYWLVDPGGPGSPGGRVGTGDSTPATGRAEVGRASGAVSGAAATAERLPSLTSLRLVDGIYQEEATVQGNEPYTADFPFPVTVVPADLVE